MNNTTKFLRLLLCIFASLIFSGCMKSVSTREDEMIVWLKPGMQRSSLQLWIDSFNVNREARPVKDCADCDRSLVLLRGADVATFLSGHPVRGESSSGAKVPSTGEIGPVYFSRNYNMTGNDIIEPFSLKSDTPRIGSYKYSTVAKVAVFDTGLEPDEVSGSFLFPETGITCIPGAYRGWNFAVGDGIGIPNVNDDHPPRHGTTVTRFIIDQVLRYRTNPVEILTVKTHTAGANGKLFDVLCGFAYAQKRGAKIINASFGFYSPRLDPIRYPIDPNSRLLREYISYYLKRNNILLVAAAGNQDDLNEMAAVGASDFAALTPDDRRNLDKVHFYPASLAADTACQNIISVTTVAPDARTVSPLQNHSSLVVDIGVTAESVSGPHYVFRNPRSAEGTSAEGSSFATPIFVGKLCANYYQYQHLLGSTTPVPKLQIMNFLFSNSVLRTAPEIASKIKFGVVTP